MAGRFIRKTAVLAGIETIYGTDVVPTGAANAMLVSNLTLNPLAAQNVDRALIRAYFGASEQLVGVANVQASFDVEIAGSGTAGTAPAWGPLLRACSFAQVITVGNRVEYTPISDNQESATIYWADDGVLHKLLGVRGTVQFKLNLAGKPVMSFSFTGLYGGITAAANPTVDLSAFKPPLVVSDPNTGDITFGCTYAAGALTGGTAYPSRGIEINVGNQVEHTPLLGEESVDVTDRTITGTMQLRLLAADEVTFMTTVRTNALQSIGFVHGTTAGNIFGLHAPAVQLTNPSKQDMNGRRLLGYDARFTPLAGNDELRIFLK